MFSKKGPIQKLIFEYSAAFIGLVILFTLLSLGSLFVGLKGSNVFYAAILISGFLMILLLLQIRKFEIKKIEKVILGIINIETMFLLFSFPILVLSRTHASPVDLAMFSQRFYCSGMNPTRLPLALVIFVLLNFILLFASFLMDFKKNSLKENIFSFVYLFVSFVILLLIIFYLLTPCSTIE